MPANSGAGMTVRFSPMRGRLRTRVRRVGPATLTAMVVGGLLLFLGKPGQPRLVWNASASAPVGLYAVRPAANIVAGDMVIAWAPEPARAFAARRQYLPGNVPLVKRVAASEGARICARGDFVLIDGRIAAVRRRTDGRGRALPVWLGCRRLGPGELFLLMDRPDSFDGRYFGTTPARLVVGKALPLWVG